MDKLKMTETNALDFARYLVEQGSEIPSYDQTDIVNNMVMVNQQRTQLACRVVMFIVSQISSGLVYFSSEKDEKMKLIIGEKL